MKRILIFHPAAIGDAVLATPVAVALKKQFPSAQLIYLSHESLFPLLKLCKAIDAFLPYSKSTKLSLIRKQIRELKFDLIVDLSGSSKSCLATVFCAPKIVRYRKQAENVVPIQHAVDNFLATISSLLLPSSASTPSVSQKFPTLEIDSAAREEMQNILRKKVLQQLSTSDHLESAGQLDDATNYQLIGFVPGVGKFRPHRAWPEAKWKELVHKIQRENRKTLIVLVGGLEETALCGRIAQSFPSRCFSFAGELNLPETAALLNLCSAVISGDTGPAHIGVAVGTKVIGLNGPTFPERSGPYGMIPFGVNACDQCSCQSFKVCQFTGENQPGRCMDNINVEAVYDALQRALKAKFSASAKI